MKETTADIMLDVIIALLPATFMGVYYFGLNAALVILTAIASCVLFEYLYEFFMHKNILMYYVNIKNPKIILKPPRNGDFTKKAVSGDGTLIDWGVHYLDLILYCCGEPKPLTASGQAYCKLGKNIQDYVYTSMWAENTADMNGTFDVDDSVTGFIRTDGPTITFNGAWAQNIGESETYIDFIGDKAGIRLQYCGNFTLYSVKDGMLLKTEPSYKTNNFYEDEIASFIDCVRKHERNRADIDLAINTSKIMQAIYDSCELRREVTID